MALAEQDAPAGLNRLARLFGTSPRLLGRLQATVATLAAVMVAAEALILLLSLDLPLERRLLGAGALIGWVLAWGLSWRLGRFWALALALETFCIGVSAVALAQPLVLPPLLLAGMLFHGLHRSGRRAAVAAAAYAAGAAALLTLDGGAQEFLPGATLTVVTVGVAVAVLRLLVRNVDQHEQAADREKLVASASGAVLEGSDREAMYGALLSAAGQFIPDRTDVRFRVLSGTGEHLVVRAALGGWVKTGLGTRIAMSGLPEGFRNALAHGRPLDIEGDDAASLFDALGFTRDLAVNAMFVVPVTEQDELGAVIAIADDPLSTAFKDALAAVAAQVKLGLARVQLLEGLERAQRRFRGLVEHSSGVITLMDVEGRISYVSPTVERVLGYEAWQLIGRTFLELVHPSDTEATTTQLLRVRAEARAQTAPFECRIRSLGGGWVPVETVGNNLLDDPDVGAIVFNSRDVRERKELEKRLDHAAFHDDLTGLPNRALLHNRLGLALNRAGQYDEPVTVLVVDIDDFKGVNDRFGPQAGDRLLLGVAERLRACVGPADTLARVDGDEFAILLGGPHTTADVIATAEHVAHALTNPFAIGHDDIEVRASVGIAAASDALEPDNLLREAEVAMHAAKREGKGRVQTFEPSMHAAVVERLEIEEALRHAVERREMSVRYQPIVELASGRIRKVEALVRWDHPVRGTMSPAAFIPIAERSGSILPIGGWVLREACRQARRLTSDLPAGPISVAVNLSSRQLDDPLLLDEVSAALEESRLTPSLLTLEITESVIMGNVQGAVAQLQHLKQLGVKLAIDDFGTGYSSLSYLKRFPVDILKMDKSFIDGIARSPQDAALARTILQLAASLGLDVVAEGIEHYDQMEVLLGLECRFGQGYLFSRPVDGETLSILVDGSVAPLRTEPFRRLPTMSPFPVHPSGTGTPEDPPRG